MDYAPHLTTSGLMELIKGEQKWANARILPQNTIYKS
jgi:hypothetical protein